MRTVLFDLDGTLVDTAPDLCAVLNSILGDEGFESVDLGVVRGIIGGGVRVMLTRGLEHNGVTVESIGLRRFEQLVDVFFDRYSANIAVHSQVFEHVVPVLEDFAAQGVKMGVVTNKTEFLARQALSELGLLHFFPVVIGGNTLPVAKPDARPVFASLWRLGCADSSNAILVGDSATDVNAARAAGVRSVVVPYGYSLTPADQLGADVLIDDFRGLRFF